MNQNPTPSPLSPAQKLLQELRAQRGSFLHPVRIELSAELVFEAQIKTLSDADVVELQALAESRPSTEAHGMVSAYHAALLTVGIYKADDGEERYFGTIDEAADWQHEPALTSAVREVRRLLVEKNPFLEANVLFLPGEEVTPESGGAVSKARQRYSAIRERAEFEDVETITLGLGEHDTWHIRHLSAGELQELDTFMLRDGDGAPQMEEKRAYEGFLGACLFYGLAESETGGHFFIQSVEGWTEANVVAQDTNPEVIAVNQQLFFSILLLNPSIWPEQAALFKEVSDLAAAHREAAGGESGSEGDFGQEAGQTVEAATV